MLRSSQIEPNWQSTILLGSVGIVLMYFYFKNKHSYWKRLGIKGPPTTFIFGNMLDAMFSDFMAKQLEWLKSYGKYYGYYLGTKPVLAIGDPEVVRQICIKDFHIFAGHEIDVPLTEFHRNFVFFMSGPMWKRTRALMSPGFTSGKIKRIHKLLHPSVHDLLTTFNNSLAAKAPNDQGATVDLEKIFTLYTLDCIAAGCYGMKLDWNGASDIKTAASRSNAVAATAALFHLRFWRVLFIAVMPRFFIDYIGFTMQKASDFVPLTKFVKQLIEKRRSTTKYDDYLQILVDTKLGDELEFDGTDDNQSHHIGATKQSLIDDHKKITSDTLSNQSKASSDQNEIKLTEKNIIISASLLLVAGLEAATNLLTNTCYLLAFHQDIQERLHKELKEIVDIKTGEFTYDNITACNYLDAVVSESLRILAPMSVIDRVAETGYVIEKFNIAIEKGTKVNIMAYSIMNDPDYWTEPGKFNPDRFMPGEREKIVPGSYCPFGLGPRHCLGMRFALTESKVALATMVMKYRFEPAPGTSFPPKTVGGLGMTKISNPMVNIIPRSHV